MTNEMPKGEFAEHSGRPRIQRKIEQGALRTNLAAPEDEPIPEEAEHEVPKIVMPPPPQIPGFDPATEEVFDFGAGISDSDDEEPTPGPARVAIPQSTASARLNRPEDEI